MEGGKEEIGGEDESENGKEERGNKPDKMRRRGGGAIIEGSKVEKKKKEEKGRVLRREGPSRDRQGARPKGESLNNQARVKRECEDERGRGEDAGGKEESWRMDWICGKEESERVEERMEKIGSGEGGGRREKLRGMEEGKDEIRE